MVVIIVVVVSWRLTRAKNLIDKVKKRDIVVHNVNSLKDDVKDMEKNMNNEDFRRAMIERIKSKLSKLEDFVTNDASSKESQVNLKYMMFVDRDLDDTISLCEKCETLQDDGYIQLQSFSCCPPFN